MKKLLIKTLLVIISSLSSVYSQSIQNYADIGDFKLLSGDTIKNCQIGYRTFGKLNSDSSNVIIYPTWFAGTTEDISTLITKHSFVDSTKYFIIAIDALGNGVSSSPSNYEYDDTVFNNLTISDMVNSQYKFLTEIVGIKHLFAAIGGSMGSMQVLQWAVSYPHFIDKIVAYLSTPKMSSYDLLWMNTQLNMIESSRKNGMSDREIKKISDMITQVLARTPAYVVEHTHIEDFHDYLASFDKEPSKIFTLDNYLVSLKAMMRHDISINFNGSMEDAAKNIFAKLFIIVSETDMIVNPTAALNLARLTNAQSLILNNNCGHLAVGCEINLCRDEISVFLGD